MNAVGRKLNSNEVFFNVFVNQTLCGKIRELFVRHLKLRGHTFLSQVYYAISKLKLRYSQLIH